MNNIRDNRMANLDKYGYPVASPITQGTPSQGVVPWQFGMEQKIQGKGMIMHKPITTGGTLSTPFVNNMTALNSSLGTLIDTLGLVSTTSFSTDGASGNVAGSTSSLTPVSVTGSTLANLILTRPAKVMTLSIANGFNNYFYNSSANAMQVQLVDSIQGTLTTLSIVGDYTLSNIDFVGQSFSLNIAAEITTVPSLNTWSAGTHSMHLQYQSVNGGTSTLANWGLLYIVFGV